MKKIIEFPVKNAAIDPDVEIDPDVVLEKSVGEFESVVVVGWDKEGCLDVRASLNLTQAEINWLLGVVQHKLLRGDYLE